MNEQVDKQDAPEDESQDQPRLADYLNEENGSMILDFTDTISRLKKRADTSRTEYKKERFYLSTTALFAVFALLAVTVGAEQVVRLALAPGQTQVAIDRLEAANSDVKKADGELSKAQVQLEKATEAIRIYKQDLASAINTGEKTARLLYESFQGTPLEPPDLDSYDLQVLDPALIEGDIRGSKIFESLDSDKKDKIISAFANWKKFANNIQFKKSDVDRAGENLSTTEGVMQAAESRSKVARGSVENLSKSLGDVKNAGDTIQDSIIRGAAVAGAIGIAVFLMQIFLSSMRYYARLAEFYDAQADALTASAGEGRFALILLERLSPLTIEFGRTPQHLYGKVLDTIGEVAKGKIK